MKSFFLFSPQVNVQVPSFFVSIWILHSPPLRSPAFSEFFSQVLLASISLDPALSRAKTAKAVSFVVHCPAGQQLSAGSFASRRRSAKALNSVALDVFPSKARITNDWSKTEGVVVREVLSSQSSLWSRFV